MSDPQPLSPSPVELDIARIVDDARAGARRRGAPVLLRLGLSGGRVDPMLAFDRALASGQRAAFWREPGSGLRFAALGALDDRPIDSLTDAGDAWRRWHGALHAEGDAPGPVALFGAAFDRDRTVGDHIWGAWPRVELTVPERVIAVDPSSGRRWFTVQHIIDPAGDAATDRRTLTAHMDGVMALEGGCIESGAPAAHAVDDEPRDSWCRRVAEITEACGHGALNKVVPARAARFDAPPGTRFDAAATLAALDARHPTARVFGFAHDGRAFVGATPELLARLGDRLVDTHALAGTAPRDDDPQADMAFGHALLNSDKDRREHDLVVEAITDALGPLSEAVMVDGTPRLRRLPSVQHLETAIRARLLPGVSLLDVADRLHPTPALGGQPRAEALAWLSRTERLDRGWYGAPVGWLDASGGGVAAVAIRSGLVAAETAWTFAGAGVVAGSDPATEWVESALKLGTMGDALRLVPVEEAGR